MSLATESERFSTAAPDEMPAPAIGEGDWLPFSLEFATRIETEARDVPWQFDVDQQVNVDTDGVPVFTVPSAMTYNTTGPSPDGGPNTGGEEYNPDFHGGDDDECRF
ncbi:hypothetical protein [Salininema proteolyticum]|uniref:ATP-grasp target RiPP n=1 Tax=Salininema proteolyticum TaxID=1607685 RepID=A0ABV8TZM1_9ACTN